MTLQSDMAEFCERPSRERKPCGMKSDELMKDDKKELAFLLKKAKLMPVTSGRVIIETTAEQTIGKIEVTTIHR